MKIEGAVTAMISEYPFKPSIRFTNKVALKMKKIHSLQNNKRHYYFFNPEGE